MADSFYTLPMISFLSDNLFMVSWSQNRTADTQQYRFYTISSFNNEIDTVLDDQYTDDRILNIWYDNHYNLSGYYNKLQSTIHLTDSFPFRITQRTTNVPSNPISILETSTYLNITSELFNHTKYGDIYHHPSTTQYVSTFIYKHTPNTLTFFIGDLDTYPRINSVDQIQPHSASNDQFASIFYGSIRVCFSSDAFVAFGLGNVSSQWYLFGISYKLNGVPLVSQPKIITSDQMLNSSHPGGIYHPVCRTRNDGLIIVCYEVPPFVGIGADVACNLVDPNTLESVQEKAVANHPGISEHIPQLVIYPNDDFVVCHAKANDGIYCTMMDQMFNILVSEKQITYPDPNQQEADGYFKLAHVRYRNTYRFIMVWQRAAFYVDSLGINNDYDYVKMIICQDSEQSYSPTMKPTINPTTKPTEAIPITTLDLNAETGWVKKELNCPDGFIDLDANDPMYDVYCQRCPDGTAGTYGQCDKCGTLEEPNHSRTECEFINPWWLYVIEVLSGFGFVAGIIACLHRKLRKPQKKKDSFLYERTELEIS
eukprot:287213_1